MDDVTTQLAAMLASAVGDQDPAPPMSLPLFSSYSGSCRVFLADQGKGINHSIEAAAHCDESACLHCEPFGPIGRIGLRRGLRCSYRKLYRQKGGHRNDRNLKLMHQPAHP